MKLSDEQARFDDDLTKLREFAKSLGFKVVIGEVARSYEQQKIYFDSGRSRTMNSRHLQKCAADLDFYKIFPPEKNETWINGMGRRAIEILAPIGEFWESLNLKNHWGGNFDRDWSREDTWHDVPHFERAA